MRWNNPKFIVGKHRKRQKFLWKPMRIYNETRWLEIAIINEVACLVYKQSLYGYYLKQTWKPVNFC